MNCKAFRVNCQSILRRPPAAAALSPPPERQRSFPAGPPASRTAGRKKAEPEGSAAKRDFRFFRPAARSKGADGPYFRTPSYTGSPEARRGHRCWFCASMRLLMRPFLFFCFLGLYFGGFSSRIREERLFFRRSLAARTGSAMVSVR